MSKGKLIKIAILVVYALMESANTLTKVAKAVWVAAAVVLLVDAVGLVGLIVFALPAAVSFGMAFDACACALEEKEAEVERGKMNKNT